MTVPKNCTSLKNYCINITQMTNNQENSVQRFGKIYITNQLTKFLRDWVKPRRVGVLTASISYQFFKQIC